MENCDKNNLIIFILAQLITFLFIGLLQIVPFWLFIPFLILMHGGIVLFIISKKRFIKGGRNINSFYKTEYLLLALFLPILIYKFLGKIIGYTVNDTLTLSLTVIVLVIAVIVSIFNTRKCIIMLSSLTNKS